MQTTLAAPFKDTPDGIEAERILRACVHCGFCLATCPSYQILGNELDSPRGRIYLLKQLFEGQQVSAKTQSHLDTCLTCRNCETTCPSGVEYGKLLDIGRALVDARVARSSGERFKRAALGTLISRRALFSPALRAGQMLRPVLPGVLKAKIPVRRSAAPPLAAPPLPASGLARRMLVLDGCAQPALAPGINAAATRVLARLGIELRVVASAGCCGAVTFHLDDHAAARASMRRNIDAWLPALDAGAEAIVMTASGCGVMVKDYAWHLRDDPAYAAKAARVSAATRDLAEVLHAERDALVRLMPPRPARTQTLAWHAPCTLQHGQKISGVVEELLRDAGFVLCAVAESNLCCGSAGTYSILQPAIANALKSRKLDKLEAGAPDVIVTANIGCLTHLQSGTATPVRHWIEAIGERLEAG